VSSNFGKSIATVVGEQKQFNSSIK